MSSLSQSERIDLAGAVVDHITENLKVRDIFDIFDDDVIQTCCSENFSPADCFQESSLIEWARENCDPEAIFSDDTLELWARQHGFVKEFGE